ncbi:putative signal transducing protein [Snuella sedimenti]|uniref:DUF2007 domain-containing protein n=1 Tax=Snuella sedimenti TaxID=2798802 RepID=A0A8J7LY56_9FLAO|nr:DUF2007 domain-containing protein [Snuella sedimenti]MBJ6367991.1 DUF2007 domain-containing protein [Snuella sedimenti]
MSLVTIKSSRMESELLALKGRLEAEGITCYLKNEFTTQLMNYLPTFEVELQVYESDLDRVKEVMSALETD